MQKNEEINVPKLRFPEFSGEWENIKLSELTIINPTAVIPDKFKYISLESVVDGKLLYTSNEYKDTAPSRAQRRLQDKDVLYQTVRPYQLNNLIVSADMGGYVASTGYAHLRMKEKVYHRFVYYNLITSRFTKKVLLRCTGTSYPAVNSNELGKISVGTTLKDEQVKIGDFLSSLDSKIALIEQKLKLLKLYKKGLIQAYILKNHYDITPLNKILKERKEHLVKSNMIDHLSLSKDGVNLKRKNEDRDFLVKNESKKYKVTYLNDICYNPANLKFGVICKNDFGKGIFSPIYVTFTVNKGYDSEYISYLLTSKTIINKLRKYEEGTVYERMAVKPSDFLSLKVPIATEPEQQRIANFISTFNNKINETSNIVQNLKQFTLVHFIV